VSAGFRSLLAFWIGGASVATTPPPPPRPTVIPHDDYDYLWSIDRDYTKHRRRMREELGIIPKEAERIVEQAAAKILAEQPADEAQAFDMVAAFERHYREALKRVLFAARAKDYAAQWRDRVRQSLVEKDEEEALLLIASWLI